MNEPPRRPMDDDWIFDPGLAGLNRSIQKEIRDEAEEIESIIEESETRSRQLSDVAKELRNQGQLVTVATPYRDFNGFILHAGRNFVTLSCQDVEADIALEHVSFIKAVPSERQRGRAGQPVADTAGSFDMRLVERLSPRERVEVGYGRRSESLYGNLVATGQDHVIVVDDQRTEWVIPYSAIAFVARNGQRRIR
jgi:hypothetical protein